MAYEAYWADVVLALRCDGTLPITDDKGNTVVNTAVTLSATASDSGGVSARFAGTNSRLTVEPTTELHLGPGDFTILQSFQVDDSAGYRTLLDIGSTSSGESIEFLVAFWAGNLRLSINVLDGSGTSSYVSGTQDCGAITSGVMHRLMVARQGSTLYVLLDGALRLVLTDAVYDGTTDPFIMPNMRINIGNWRAGDDAETPIYVDEFYIVKGIALETAPYVTAPVFVMASGDVYTPMLPIEVDVVGRYTPALPIEVSVGKVIQPSLGLEVMVLSPGVLDGSEQVSDGVTTAARWRAVVTIDDVDRSDDIVGDVRINGARNAARVASFSFEAVGVIEPATLTGKPVTIDIAAPGGSNRMRLFTGVVDVPEIDLVACLVSVTCTDSLQMVVDAMPRDTLDTLIGGRWSPAVFSAGSSTWGYAQDRLSTVPASLDLSPFGALRVTPLAAGAVDLTFDSDMVLKGSVSVSPAERRGLVNHIDVTFGYRFPRAKREAHHVEYSYLTNGFGPWLNAGNYFLQRAAVTAGIEAAGGAIADIQWVAMPTSSLLINTGGGGVAVYIPNPAVDPLKCLGFEATVTFDYTQELDEVHKIAVTSPASIEALGLLRSTMQGSLVGETADTLASETNATLYQLGISHIPPAMAPEIVLGKTTAAVLTLTDQSDRAAAEAAIATLVDVAKTKIIASHYATTVSGEVALHPLVDTDKTITVDSQGVLATGRVESFSHVLSPATARAITRFAIALCRLDGTGVPDIETPTAAPAGVADGTTGELPDVVCHFNGLATEDQSFEITFPAVEADQRNGAQVELVSEFTVALVEDALSIDLGV